MQIHQFYWKSNGDVYVAVAESVDEAFEKVRQYILGGLPGGTFVVERDEFLGWARPISDVLVYKEIP